MLCRSNNSHDLTPLQLFLLFFKIDNISRRNSSCGDLSRRMHCICLRWACAVCLLIYAMGFLTVEVHEGGRRQVCSCSSPAGSSPSFATSPSQRDAMNYQANKGAVFSFHTHTHTHSTHYVKTIRHQLAIDWSSGALWCDEVQQQWAATHSWRRTGIQTLSDISTNT